MKRYTDRTTACIFATYHRAKLYLTFCPVFQAAAKNRSVRNTRLESCPISIKSSKTKLNNKNIDPKAVKVGKHIFFLKKKAKSKSWIDYPCLFVRVVGGVPMEPDQSRSTVDNKYKSQSKKNPGSFFLMM